MATEAQRAPRVARGQTSMADAAAAVRAKIDPDVQAVDLLNSFKINDVSVFDTSPEDLRFSAASQAHALTVVLGLAIGEAGPDGPPVRWEHIDTYLAAIGTLVGLSQLAGLAVHGGAA